MAKRAFTEKMVESLRSKYTRVYGRYYDGPRNYPECVVSLFLEPASIIQVNVCIGIVDNSCLISVIEDLGENHFHGELQFYFCLDSVWDNQLLRQAIRCGIEVRSTIIID